MRQLTFVNAKDRQAYLGAATSVVQNTGGNIEIKYIGNSSLQDDIKHQLHSLLSHKHSHKECIVKLIIIVDNNPITVCDTLHSCIDADNIHIIAPITKKYYKNTPLFLIGIPKSGTHLIFELAAALGYTARRTSPEKPKGGEWYYIEHDNAHTRAKRFFVESVYEGIFGLRNHPFVYSPALFIYRHPADIVTSEANYYHKKGRTPFYNYFSHQNFEQRLLKLIDDPYLLGSIKDRVLDFIPWLDFGNVIPLSFEEIIGSNGGGSDELKEKLIWSVQLKLHVPGSPSLIADKISEKRSDTFFKGKCGVYRDMFSKDHWDAFNNLESEFYTKFGYDFSPDAPIYSSKIAGFRNRTLVVDTEEEWPPYIVNNQYLNHRIIEYERKLYGVPFGTPLSDLKKHNQNSNKIITGNYIDEVKSKLLIKHLATLKKEQPTN